MTKTQEVYVTHFTVSDKWLTSVEPQIKADATYKRMPGNYSAKGLPEGKFYFPENVSGFVVAIAEAHDWMSEFKALGSDDQDKCSKDGFLRQHVNRVASIAEKTVLGMVEVSASATRTVKALNDQAKAIYTSLRATGMKEAEARKHSKYEG